MFDESLGDNETMVGGDGLPPGSGYALQAGSVVGQYRIVRPLGRGGMGEVYEAENTVNRKRVALKVLPRAATGGTFVERFKIESRVMMDLRHAHIVQVHHAGEDNELYYLTMDLVTGPDGEPRSLEERLEEEGGKLKEEEVRRIALQIVDALEYAHKKGIVHRDLKPANVLLDEEGNVRVTDFGLAKVIGSEYLQTVIQRSISLSLAGGVSLGDLPTLGEGAGRGVQVSSSARALLGTYDYMAPEQKAGGQITPRTDIYAFGVMLYRMLTGEKPEGAWDPPSKFGAAKRWDDIVLRCLKSDPSERFCSVSVLKSQVLVIGQHKRQRVARRALAVVVAGIGLGLAGFVGWWLGRGTREVSFSYGRPEVSTGIQQRAGEVSTSPPEAVANKDGRARIALEERKEPRAGEERVIDLGNGVTLTLVWIPATTSEEWKRLNGGEDTFTMGSPDDEPGRDSDEGPQHEVRLTKGFWMGKYEVTQRQYQQLMGENPSWFKNAGPDAPVERVTWHQAKAFCERLQARLPAEMRGMEVRLPTEAEWEYACRAGTRTAIYTGALTIRGEHNGPELDPIAWYGGNSGVQYEGGLDSSGWPSKQYNHARAGTHPVGRKLANAWGLHDMLGNVWEWCWDGKREYTRGLQVDPVGPTGGSRVVRGGSWYCNARNCRSADRLVSVPGYSYDFLGFRVVVR